MKIAFIIPALKNQGPIIVLKHLLNSIHDKFSLIDVFVLDEKTKEIELKANIYFIKMKDVIKFSKYDIIHSHMLRPDYYIWKNKKNIDPNKTKCISTVHQYIFKNLISSYNLPIAILFNIFWKLFLRKSDILVFLTDSMKLYYTKDFRNQNLVVVNNGIPIKNEYNDCTFPIKEKISQYKRLGVIGSLISLKGYDQVIKALAILTDYCLIIIGEGKERRALENLAKKLNVFDRCFFLGYKKNATDYLQFMDIFVLSSRSEGFGLVLIEAAQKKKAIVCSDINTFKEMFDNEVRFFELDNIQSLAKSIEFAYNNLNELGQSAYKKFFTNYTSELMANNYYNIYCEALKNVNCKNVTKRE